MIGIKAFLLIYITLLFTSKIYAAPNAPYDGHSLCLSDKDARHIIRIWHTLFEGGPDVRSLGEKYLAPDFVLYDEGLASVFGQKPPLNPVEFPSKKAFIDYFAGPQLPTTSAPTFSTILLFHDCNSIAWRWELHAVVTGIDKSNNLTYAPTGTVVEYKGNDLLQVDVKTMRIKRAYTTGDLINYLFEIGSKLLSIF